MPPTETTKETEFIFRRLGDSFLQFTTDFWQSVPKLLLILAVLAVLAKFAYARCAGRAATASRMPQRAGCGGGRSSPSQRS